MGEGANINHKNVIINGIVGNNCTFNGNNCIGVGKSGYTPKIGNNITFGWGACVFGDVELADGIQLGAGSIVVRSITIKNSTVVGIPGKPLV